MSKASHGQQSTKLGVADRFVFALTLITGTSIKRQTRYGIPRIFEALVCACGLARVGSWRNANVAQQAQPVRVSERPNRARNLSRSLMHRCRSYAAPSISYRRAFWRDIEFTLIVRANLETALLAVMVGEAGLEPAKA
jgi:hypothetical protein